LDVTKAERPVSHRRRRLRANRYRADLARLSLFTESFRSPPPAGVLLRRECRWPSDIHRTQRECRPTTSRSVSASGNGRTPCAQFQPVGLLRGEDMRAHRRRPRRSARGRRFFCGQIAWHCIMNVATVNSRIRADPPIQSAPFTDGPTPIGRFNSTNGRRHRPVSLQCARRSIDSSAARCCQLFERPAP
jgi:hypothetical protein